MTFMLLLAAIGLASSPASAAEATPQTATQQARATYKTELIKLRDDTMDTISYAACEAAIKTYRDGEAEMLRIETELAAITGTPLGTVQASYRATLLDQKPLAEGKMAEGKTAATKAGQALTTAQANLVLIDDEIARIRTAEQYEAKAGQKVKVDPNPGLRSALGSTGLNADMMNGLSGLIGARGTEMPGDATYVIPVPERPRPPLPQEFDICEGKDEPSS